MIWLLAPSPVSKLSLLPTVFLCVAAVKLSDRGGGGAISYDDEEARSSINQSLLSAICLPIRSLGFSIEGGVRA